MKNNPFFQVCGVVLALAAIGKLLSIAKDAAVIKDPDPVFGMSTTTVLFAVSTVEFATCVLLLSPVRWQIKVLSVLWISGAFLIYRLGLQMVAPTKTCPCLGSLAEWLPLSDTNQSRALSATALVMMLGGVLLLARKMRCARPKGASV